MALVIVLLLIALIVIVVVVKRRPYNPRREGMKQVRRAVRSNREVTESPTVRAMLAADDAIPRIGGFVDRLANEELTSQTPGIVFIEAACAYTFFVGTNAIRRYPEVYEQYMGAFAGALVDYAQYDLHWPESSLQTFGEKLQRSTIVYAQVSQRAGIDGVTDEFMQNLSSSRATPNGASRGCFVELLNDMQQDTYQLSESQ